MHRPLSRKHIHAARQNSVFEWIIPVSPRDGFQTFHSANQTFPSQNLPVMSLRGGRIFAPDAAILKFPFRNPRTRYGDTNRHPPILIRPGGTPPRRFPGSAISRGRKSAFPVRQHISLARKANFTAQPRPCFVPGCHAFGSKIATAALRPRNDTKNGRFFAKTYQFSTKILKSVPEGHRHSAPLGRYITRPEGRISYAKHISHSEAVYHCAARPAHCGNRTVTVVPTPGVLSSRIVPR